VTFSAALVSLAERGVKAEREAQEKLNTRTSKTSTNQIQKESSP
jgi:hypothetical protein